MPSTKFNFFFENYKYLRKIPAGEVRRFSDAQVLGDDESEQVFRYFSFIEKSNFSLKIFDLFKSCDRMRVHE